MMIDEERVDAREWNMEWMHEKKWERAQGREVIDKSFDEHIM